MSEQKKTENQQGMSRRLVEDLGIVIFGGAVVFILISVFNTNSSPPKQPQQQYTHQQQQFSMPRRSFEDPNSAFQDYFRNPDNQNNPLRVESQRRAAEINQRINDYNRGGGFLTD